MIQVFFSFDHRDIERAIVVRDSWVQGKEDRLAFGFMQREEFEAMESEEESEFIIQSWVDEQLEETSVTVILFTQKVYKSFWVKYAIRKSIEKKNGLIGIDISQIRDLKGRTSNLWKTPRGYNFYSWLDNHGEQNIENWIERALIDENKGKS